MEEVGSGAGAVAQSEADNEVGVPVAVHGGLLDSVGSGLAEEVATELPRVVEVDNPTNGDVLVGSDQ